MSAPETINNIHNEPAPFDPTSSITVTVNAKQQHQWTIKVRAQSNAPQDVREAFDLAVELDGKAQEKYGVPK